MGEYMENLISDQIDGGLELKKQQEENTYKENPNQTTRVLWHLKAGHKLTALDALNLFGCWRLGARIHNIRAMGFNVKTDYITTSTKKVIAEYSLMKGYYQTTLF